MKKVLKFIVALMLSSPISLLAIACNNSHSNSKIYDSIGAGIKDLKINSFAAIKENINSVVNGIKYDVVNGLYRLKFTNNVNINDSKVVISSDDIISLDTNNKLSEKDLVTSNNLNLQVTVSYFNIKYQLASANLTVSNKSDQEIISYIKNYDYNSIFLDDYNMIAPGIDIKVFSKNLKVMLLNALGSFANSYIEKDNLSLNAFDKNNFAINQSDLNTLGKLNLNVNYTYDGQDNTTSVAFNIAKFNIAKFKSIPWVQQVITLPQEKNLISADINFINNSIKSEINNNLKSITDLTWSNYQVATSDYSVSYFTSFNIGDTLINGMTILVNFDIISNSNSNLITGILNNKTIQVILLTKN